MITIEGGGMVGMPGIAGRIFASVAAAGVTDSATEEARTPVA